MGGTVGNHVCYVSELSCMRSEEAEGTYPPTPVLVKAAPRFFNTLHFSDVPCSQEGKSSHTSSLNSMAMH